ncbi:MAG: hypothetical protein D6723_19915 [Acidobacteria bacterium]|nr:MAG: hypothetical protein D6723_19915 [Acidobacteriota bacterium]
MNEREGAVRRECITNIMSRGPRRCGWASSWEEDPIGVDGWSLNGSGSEVGGGFVGLLFSHPDRSFAGRSRIWWFVERGTFVRTRAVQRKDPVRRWWLSPQPSILDVLARQPGSVVNRRSALWADDRAGMKRPFLDMPMNG